MKRALSTVLVLSLGSALTQQAMAQAPNATAVDFGPRNSATVGDSAATAIDFGPQAPASRDFNSTVIDSTASPYDQALLAEVRAAITSDLALRGADLAVSVSGGRVHISGSALDETQARHAASVAMRIAGSSRVSSAIATTR
ncbi:MAG: BON domain-containing protein [Pseudomonadota bacterium]|nr:BON domain-containing protein [Pseudomonadota bacterium]